MNVNNATSSVGNTGAVQRVVQQPVQKEVPVDAGKQLPLTDRVELSGMSSLMASLKAGKDFRADKVAAVKAQIEAGTYESDDKLDVAADRVLDDLLK